MGRRYIWLIAIVVFVGLPVFAGQILYTAFRSPKRVVMKCADFLRNKPDDVWLDLQDCKVDVVHGIRISATTGELPTDADYAPVVAHYNLNPGGNESVFLLLKLPSDQAEFLNALPPNPTQQQIDAVAPQFRAMMGPRRIKGLIQVGIDSDDKTRRAIEGTQGVILAAGWKIIEQKEPPPIWIALILLAIPLGLGGFLWWRWHRRIAAADDAEAQALRELR